MKLMSPIIWAILGVCTLIAFVIGYSLNRCPQSQAEAPQKEIRSPCNCNVNEIQDLAPCCYKDKSQYYIAYANGAYIPMFNKYTIRVFYMFNDEVSAIPEFILKPKRFWPVYTQDTALMIVQQYWEFNNPVIIPLK